MNAAAPRFHGYVETIGTDRVTGWCIDQAVPGQPVMLVAMAHGVVLGRAQTSIDRPDVARAEGCHRVCGFDLPLGPAAAGVAAREISVRPQGGRPLVSLDPASQPARMAAATAPVLPPAATARLAPPPTFPPLHEIDAALADALLAQPFPLERAAAAPAGGPAGPLQGRLVAVEHGEARGWARRRQAGPLLVELRVDGLAAGQQQAARPRPGPVGSGFALPLPDQAFDNQPHEIAVVEAATGEPLTGSPITLRLAAGGGSVRLRRGVLEGRVDYGDRAFARLELVVDGEALHGAPPSFLRAQANPSGSFAIPLPVGLHDDLPHAVALRDLGTGALLEAGPAGPTLLHLSPLRGRLEGFVGGVLHGWALDLRQPGTAVTVRLFDADRLVAETRTGETRPDLGDGAMATAGFRLPVPRALFDGTAHRLRVSLGALDLCLENQREITGSLGAAEVDDADHRFRGQLEQATPERISGWAVDTLAADRPVQVVIELDGVVIGTARADRYQTRFRSLSPHGQHGFDWPVPAECWNGRHRRLQVRIIGAREQLAGSPAELHFPSRLLPPPAGQAPRLVPPPLRPAARPAPGLVSAIVLNRNGAALLEALFASLVRHARTPLEVVLVDHASTDDSLAVAARWAAQLNIRVDARAENHSFSASNNRGAWLARGKHLLFLNNDIAFTHDPLPAMLRALAAPGVAAVGARLAEPVVQADGSLRPVLHHDGIGFRLLHGGSHGRSQWLPHEVEADAADPSEGTDAAPAATAAMLLLRRADFLALGGFDEGFDYGLEDVDLCLRLRRDRGQVVVARDAVAMHQRSATRGLRFAAALADPVQAGSQGREVANRQHFLRRQAAWLKRRLRQAALAGEGGWRETRFRLGFALGRDADAALAVPLAAALAETAGWDAALLDHGEPDWRGLDALVALHPGTNLRRMVNATPGVLVAAWVQGQVGAWLAAGQLPACDLIFAASPRLAEALHRATGLDVVLLPPGTDPQRFAPPPEPPPAETDLLFAGPADPAVPALLAGLQGLHASILGPGWAATEPLWRGEVAGHDLAATYAAARLVLDVATPEQAEGAVLDPRVLDAAACGSLPLTDNVAAAEALLPGLIPTFSDAAGLGALAASLLSDPSARAAAATRLRAAVLAGHDWANRAAIVADQLRQAASRLRFGIKLGGPATAADQALLLALRRQGHAARLDEPAAWQDGIGAGDDASLVLGEAPGFEPDARALALWWPQAEVAPPLPAGFDHGFADLPPPAADDTAGWDGVASRILSETQRLLLAPRIG